MIDESVDLSSPIESGTSAGGDAARHGRRNAVVGVLSGTALALVSAIALVMIVIPILLHATPFTVLTGSMRPSMPPGSLVVSRAVDPSSIEIGDVVTYQLESNRPEVVTHRVVGVGYTSEGERSFVTRGDANGANDEPVRAVQVRGAVVYHLPYLGYVNSWVGVNRPGWLLKAAAGALIVYGLVLVGSGFRDKFRRRHLDDEAAVEQTGDLPAAPAPAVVTLSADVPLVPHVARVVERQTPNVPPGGVVVAVVVVGLVVGLAVAGRRLR